MALTITSVTPASGITGGREMVVIQGTDFNIAVDSNGNSRMEIYFGTDLATRVRVRSATMMDCLTPIHDIGTVNIKAKDLNTSVEFTLNSAFTFARPSIGGVSSDISYVTEVLVLEMKKQLIEEIVVGSAIDFDSDTADALNLINIAKTPAIVLDGPRVYNSGGPLHRTGENWEQVSVGVANKEMVQDICNFDFTLIGVDNHKVRLLNLLSEVIKFFRRNSVLRIRSDPNNPNSIVEEADMRPPMPQDWNLVTSGNKSNLKFFSGVFTIFGIPIGHDGAWDVAYEITDARSGIRIIPL